MILVWTLGSRESPHRSVVDGREPLGSRPPKESGTHLTFPEGGPGDLSDVPWAGVGPRRHGARRCAPAGMADAAATAEVGATLWRDRTSPARRQPDVADAAVADTVHCEIRSHRGRHFTLSIVSDDNNGPPQPS